MTFKEAFKNARDKGQATFTWNGNKYHTKTKDEMQKAASAKKPQTRTTSANKVAGDTKPKARPAAQSTKAPSTRPKTRTTSAKANPKATPKGGKGATETGKLSTYTAKQKLERDKEYSKQKGTSGAGERFRRFLKGK